MNRLPPAVAVWHLRLEVETPDDEPAREDELACGLAYADLDPALHKRTAWPDETTCVACLAKLRLLSGVARTDLN